MVSIVLTGNTHKHTNSVYISTFVSQFNAHHHIQNLNFKWLPKAKPSQQLLPTVIFGCQRHDSPQTSGFLTNVEYVFSFFFFFLFLSDLNDVTVRFHQYVCKFKKAAQSSIKDDKLGFGCSGESQEMFSEW